MSKIVSFLRKPIITISLLTILFTVILFVVNGYSFNTPDYYTNREAALQAAQIADPNAAALEVSKYKNELYRVYNNLFQIWGWLVSILIFTIIFQIKDFIDFKNIKTFRKKLFVYLWINLSYILYCICWVPAYMADIEKYVYNAYQDTLAIPLFNTIFGLADLAINYYAITNILFFIIYNTKIKSRFYSFIVILGILLLTLKAYAGSFLHFSLWHIGLNVFYITWLMLLLSGLSILKEKRTNKLDK